LLILIQIFIIYKKVTNLRTTHFKNSAKKKIPQFSRFPDLQISKPFFGAVNNLVKIVVGQQISIF